MTLICLAALNKRQTLVVDALLWHSKCCKLPPKRSWAPLLHTLLTRTWKVSYTFCGKRGRMQSVFKYSKYILRIETISSVKNCGTNRKLWVNVCECKCLRAMVGIRCYYYYVANIKSVLNSFYASFHLNTSLASLQSGGVVNILPKYMQIVELFTTISWESRFIKTTKTTTKSPLGWRWLGGGVGLSNWKRFNRCYMLMHQWWMRTQSVCRRHTLKPMTMFKYIPWLDGSVHCNYLWHLRTIQPNLLYATHSIKEDHHQFKHYSAIDECLFVFSLL